MKIKTLAIAAATLAVGAITSQAQVYSQNVVGYVNQIFPAGKFVLACNPVTTGNDVLTNIFTGTVPGTSKLYYWYNNGWQTYTYSASTHLWKNGSADVSNTNLPPGAAFFFLANANYTNTFAGTIVANTGGGKATNTLATGYQPVGALIPYADTVTNTGTFNLVVAGTSTIQTWNVASQAYDTAYQYSASTKNWKQGSTVTNPVIAVGQGFFISPATATNWVQTLQ